MITLVLLTLGALNDPTYRANGIDLTQGEALWLAEEQVDHARQLRALVDNTIRRNADIAIEIAELTVERDALPDGAEKTALTTQIDRIEKGANERAKVTSKKFKALAQTTPDAKAARRYTLATVYDPETDAITATVATPGQMTLAESGWPALVFTAADANTDGTVTAAELTTYYDGL